MPNITFTPYELRAISYAMNKVSKEGINERGIEEFRRARDKVEGALNEIEASFMKTGLTWNDLR